MNKPFVSVIVPTKDRLFFVLNILRNFYRQDYPKDRMELIIGNDGEDFGYLLPEKDEIRYIILPEMPIGYKRNFLCEQAKGDIIVFMDDDDFYPPERVSHAVENLNEHSVAGCSKINVYYTDLARIYTYGPFGKTHATCGTLAFTKEFFKKHRFNDRHQKSEEAFFLNNFTVPIKQLDPEKTILCMAHDSNTVDKHKFINDKYLSSKQLTDFVKIDADLNFYRKI